MFTKNDKQTAINNYEQNIKPFLSEKDNFTHFISFTISSEKQNKQLTCDKKTTLYIETIINELQKNGYEINDIKINNITFGFNTSIQVSIIYK